MSSLFTLYAHADTHTNRRKSAQLYEAQLIPAGLTLMLIHHTAYLVIVYYILWALVKL